MSGRSSPPYPSPPYQLSTGMKPRSSATCCFVMYFCPLAMSGAYFGSFVSASAVIATAVL